MSPRHALHSHSNETDIQLAITSIEASQFQINRCAATAFKIPRSTLNDRRADRPARRDCQPNSKKFTQLEEEVIVSYVLDLDQYEFAPTYAAVCNMADKLLAARGAGPVGAEVASQLCQAYRQSYDAF
jgi:hypothetical protein